MNCDASVFRSLRKWFHASLSATLLALVGVVLVACIPLPPDFGPLQPFPCDRFGESLWQEFNLGVDSPDDLIATVIKLWGFDRGHLRINDVQDSDNPGIGWSDNISSGLGATYSSTFRDGQLKLISFWWTLPEPALTQVIECLGPPDYYSAAFGSTQEAISLDLNFWYTEKGFVVKGLASSQLAGGKLPEVITPDFRMDLLMVLPKGLEQMAYSRDLGNPKNGPYVCFLKPWPGSIEAIEIEDSLFDPCNDSTSD